MIYTKEIGDIREYDVVVCGGGPAGFTAAIQCGREGLKTALLEKFGALGGNMTVGGIWTPGLFHAWKKQVIAGIGWELMTGLADSGWADLPDVNSGKPDVQMYVQVNSFAAARMMDVMCQEAGVDIDLHHDIIDAVCAENSDYIHIESVLAGSKEGIKAFKSGIFIDCTGDGDVAAWSGAAFEKGDPDTGELQAGSLSFYLSGFDINDIAEENVLEGFKKALEEGELMLWDYWPGATKGDPISMFYRKGRNYNHIEVDGSSSRSRSRADIQGRESVMRLITWLRKHVRGAEKVRPIFTCPQVWPRESRRIRGREYITVDDYISGKKYEDGICNSYYPMYIHKSSKELLEVIEIPENIVPAIPAGALIPRKSKNLLTAGRCISGDRQAFASFRIQATCMATGQAAGAMAACLGQAGKDAADYDIGKVRELLEKNGAILP